MNDHMSGDDDIRAELEKSRAERDQQHYVLRLYVTGMTATSMKSIETLKALCEKLLRGRYDLEVIDLYNHPDVAMEKQILATPTLIKELPLPLRRLVGDLSEPGRVIVVLK